MAFIRSAKGIDRSIHVPVRTGIVDSFHPAQHRQVQLARGTCGAVSGGAAHVVLAGAGEALSKTGNVSGRGCDRIYSPSAVETGMAMDLQS
jgi:hypothetical protein